MDECEQSGCPPLRLLVHGDAVRSRRLTDVLVSVQNYGGGGLNRPDGTPRTTTTTAIREYSATVTGRHR